MKHTFLLIFLIVVASSFISSNRNTNAFGKGEEISYTIQLGTGIVGEADLSIEKELHTFNNRPCYKAHINGKSAGLAEIMSKVRNRFYSFIDAKLLLPHKFTMHVQEGEYKRNEEISFNHTTRSAIKTNLDNTQESYTYTVPSNVQDIVSAFYYLRSINYDQMKENEIKEFDIFFDGQIIKAKFQYLGKKTITTNLGTKQTHMLMPVLPPNQFIDVKSLRMWISADEYKIPLKVMGKTEQGFASIEIQRYKKGE